MPRDIQIYGPTMVSVIGGGHMSGVPINEKTPVIGDGGVTFQLNPSGVQNTLPVWRAIPTELGLTSERITIGLQFHHIPIRVDSFGSAQSPEVMVSLAGATIDMLLVDYDDDVLDTCQAESLGGSKNPVRSAGFGYAGVMNPAGVLLGNNRKLYASGCHFVGILLDNGPPASEDFPTTWWFPSCYLVGPPQEIPVGTERSHVRLRWQAIPYAPYNLSGVSPLGWKDHLGNVVGSTLNIPFYGASGLELSSSGSIVWKKINIGPSGSMYGSQSEGPAGVYKGIYFID